MLGPGEVALWARMGAPDRRHAVAVGRRVEAALVSVPPRAVLAAALLHDVGKVEAGLGTTGRVIATMVGLTGGRRWAERWATRPGRLGQLGRYLGYPRLGAVLLEAAGSDPLTVAWAVQHHLPPDRCQLPAALAAVLRAADEDRGARPGVRPAPRPQEASRWTSRPSRDR